MPTTEGADIPQILHKTINKHLGKRFFHSSQTTHKMEKEVWFFFSAALVFGAILIYCIKESIA